MQSQRQGVPTSTWAHPQQDLSPLPNLWMSTSLLASMMMENALTLASKVSRLEKRELKRSKRQLALESTPPKELRLLPRQRRSTLTWVHHQHALNLLLKLVTLMLLLDSMTTVEDSTLASKDSGSEKSVRLESR